MIEIKTFTMLDSALYNLALKIRHKVFIDEQQVPPDLEIENEESSSFYLLFQDGLPVATGRYRETGNGIKLERFAVLPGHRNKNLGTLLLKKVLDDLKYSGKSVYLHSQLRAVPFYEREGFVKVGEMFEEAGIKHFTMVRISK
jgi:predicted GNAT family N-acyltransferase